MVIEDAVPDPPDEATTQPGDLWLLGGHRLLCGDNAKPEDVDRLLHAWFGNLARVLLPGRAFYLWGGYSKFTCPDNGEAHTNDTFATCRVRADDLIATKE